ncbi:MAG: prevent-host-death protein [Deltaproteobacteria bacterium]|nr:prevent-host-death protein [Deltaproteobacteria bacterium]
MLETTIAELRKQTKYYFDAVERGNMVRVYRKGRMIADIVPVTREKPSWKRPVPRITVPGITISREIIKDRENTDR